MQDTQIRTCDAAEGNINQDYIGMGNKSRLIYTLTIILNAFAGVTKILVATENNSIQIQTNVLPLATYCSLFYCHSLYVTSEPERAAQHHAEGN